MSSTNSLPSVSTFSVTNGGTAEILASADATRQSLFIQPKTEVCIVNFGATAGLQATGTLTFAANAANTETIAVNGVTFTFKDAPGAGEIQIGATKEDTAATFVAALNASANASISVATYSLSGAIITITYDAGGTDGNAFTLADSSGAHITRGAATLANGNNTVGGVYLAQYDILDWNAVNHPQIKEDIYILSATNAAKIDYIG